LLKAIAPDSQKNNFKYFVQEQGENMRALLFTAFILFSFQLHAAPDSDYIRAEKTLGQISNGIKYLKPQDVNTYKQLTTKLGTARKHLEATASKNEPGYAALVQRWNDTRAQLASVAERWKNAPRASAPGNAASSSQIYNAIIQKYQKQNRPVLPANPTYEQLNNWVQAMTALAKEQAVRDSDAINNHFTAGRVNKQDKARFERWVLGSWIPEIKTDLMQAYKNLNGGVQEAMNLAQRINKVDPSDQNTVVNLAGTYLKGNEQRLATGLNNLKLAAIYDPFLKPDDIARRADIAKYLTAAQGKLQQLAGKGAAYSKEIAKLPKKSKLNPNSQYLWLDGNRFCEITQKGEVWINSNFVGSIEANGKVWVSGNQVGSYEHDGKVWHNGNHVGSLESNGAVWKSGSQLGLIESDGSVWIGSSDRGDVQGKGDWRRAAIVYFFDFYPR
jgi:hypothetical protein